jgi:crossover junction endodeoxyribonuclease RuvC
LKILGIDPGLIQTGFGVINIHDDNVSLVDYGVIKPNPKESLANRLLTIYEDVTQIIINYNPQIFIIEEVFYGKNIKSTMRLGQARGSAMVAAASKGLIIYEYSPRKIKQAVTGNGNAHKSQVQFMVKIKLNMNHLPEPIDAADALAIALCYESQFRENEL